MHISSVVRLTLGLKGHRVARVSLAEGEIQVNLVSRKGSKPVCSSCGGRHPGYDTLKERTWRHVRLWGIPVRLNYAPKRVCCPKCGVKVEHMPWSTGKSDLSLPLIVLLSTFGKILPLEDVARLFHVRWNTVRAAVKAQVEHGLEARDDSQVLAIGIDEISRRKGHIYVTMVYDLVGMKLLWCEEGREIASLERFFQAWGKQRCGAIYAVCMDMWKPYRKAVEKHLPHALVVYDRFHIVKSLLKAVDQVRIQEAARLGKEQGKAITGARYLFLKNWENLSAGQRERLSDIQEMNLKVNKAYLLKEDFYRFWECEDIGSAERFLDDWVWRATHSRLEPMRDFAYMVREYKQEILNYHRVPLTNAAVEGMNRKAKVVTARAYGFRTFGTLQLMLYHVLGKLPEMNTAHRFL